MGTWWTIFLYAPDEGTAQRAARAAFARVEQLNKVMSDYDPEGELDLLRQPPVGTAIPVSPDLCDALDQSLRMARLTDGAFDPTVGPLVQLWRRARRQHQLPPVARIDEVRPAIGYQKLRLDPVGRTATLTVPGMRLDLGGIGKGYAADAALKVLRERGFPCALVAASGDLAIGAPPPGRRGWRVDIGAGKDRTNTLHLSLELHHRGMSTSGDVEQYVEIEGIRYSHIVDPRTGVGLTNRLQVTIVAANTTRSDAMATAVCVQGFPAGLALVERLPDTAALILQVTPEGSTRRVESRRFRQLPRSSMRSTVPLAEIPISSLSSAGEIR
jgi:thiamine biosynthesis lipoprotein